MHKRDYKIPLDRIKKYIGRGCNRGRTKVESALLQALKTVSRVPARASIGARRLLNNPSQPDRVFANEKRSLVFPQIADHSLAGTVEPLRLSPSSEVQQVKIPQHSQLTIGRLAFQNRADLLH